MGIKTAGQFKREKCGMCSPQSTHAQAEHTGAGHQPRMPGEITARVQGQRLPRVWGAPLPGRLPPRAPRQRGQAHQQ